MINDEADIADETGNDVEDAHEHAALRAAIKSNKKCQSTKLQYKRKQIHFEEWVRNKRPEFISPGAWLRNIDNSTMENFMGHICQKKAENGEYFVPAKFQSYNHVNGYKSAILDLYDKQGLKANAEMKEMFTDFIHGYKRKVASLKQDGEMKITEGKAPLSFEGYRFLSKKAIQQKTDLPWAVFAWVFLLFCWNLMARCVSVSGIMFDHIGVEGDSITIVFPKHKGIKKVSTVYQSIYMQIQRILKSVLFSHLLSIFGRLASEEKVQNEQYLVGLRILKSGSVRG